VAEGGEGKQEPLGGQVGKKYTEGEIEAIGRSLKNERGKVSLGIKKKTTCEKKRGRFYPHRYGNYCAGKCPAVVEKISKTGGFFQRLGRGDVSGMGARYYSRSTRRGVGLQRRK